MTFIDFAVLFVGAGLLYWLVTRDMVKVRRHYPFDQTEAIVDCGVHDMKRWFLGGFVRIGVSERGLTLRQIVIPWLWKVSVFVPWEETWLRESGRTTVAISFTKVQSVEFRFNKVAIEIMQNRLRRRVPFGHVL